MANEVTNVVFAGLGGQGVITASDILADVAFRSNLDVKKSEIHGMSQRGGSVTSDVRFGRQVHSPMVPPGEADFLLVLSADQVENNLHALRTGGVLIAPDLIDESKLPSRKSLNIALLGALSFHLKLSGHAWTASLRERLPEKLLEANIKAFEYGREVAQTKSTT